MGAVRASLALIVRRRRLRWAALGLGFVYLAIYLLAVGDLNLHGFGSGADFYLVPEPLARMFERRSAFYFEAIAVASLGGVTWLVAPLNIAIGAVLGLLVGINAALGYVAWKQPRACRLRSGGGLLAALPGLLAGSACCAPTLLLVLGLPASAGLLALFSLMVPIALALLLLSLVIIARGLDAAAAE